VIYVVAENARQFEDYVYEHRLRTRPTADRRPPEAKYVVDAVTLMRCHPQPGDRVAFTGGWGSRPDAADIIRTAKSLGLLGGEDG
jgi:hypothetical protein